MSLKIKEESLHVERLVGESTTQSILQAKLDISGSAPSIARVVWVKGSAVITDSTVGSDKVSLEGYLDLDLVYMYEDLEGSQFNYQVVPFARVVAFDDYVEIIGAEEDMTVQAEVEIAAIEWELQLDQRTVAVDVLLQASAKVKQRAVYDVVTNASIQPPKKLAVDDGIFHVQTPRELVHTIYPLDCQFALEDGAVPIKQILDSLVEPKDLKTVVTAETINVSGKLAANLIYVDENGNVQHFRSHEPVDFQTSIPNKAGTTELIVEPRIKVNAKPEFAAPGLRYNVYGDLDIELALAEHKYTRLVTGLECAGCSIETRTQPIMLDHVISQKTQKVAVRGVVQLDSNYPPIREILTAKGWVRSYDVRVDDDKVFVEGSISLELVYLAHTEDEIRPLHAAIFSNAIPFQQAIVAGGAQPGHAVSLQTTIEHLQLDLINRETVEVEADYWIKLKITEPIHEDVVVEALEIPPFPEEPPTVTYVFVKNKDTLWKLSRQYHTSVDAIVAANSWLREREPAVVKTGDRLCIPRK